MRIGRKSTEGDAIVRVDVMSFEVDVEKEARFDNGVNHNWALRKLSGGLLE